MNDDRAFRALLAGPKQPNIGAIDALLTACGHTPLRNIKQHYDAEQGCWCVEGEVQSMSKPHYDGRNFEQMIAFKKELTSMLNRHGIDSHTATPDFILADTLVDHIDMIATMNRSRDGWHGLVEPEEEEGAN